MATIDFITRKDLEDFKQELFAELGRRSFRNPKQEPPKKWLKSYEVRQLLGISANTLQTLRLNGTLPHSRVGGLIFYAYEDIRKLMESTK